MLHVTKKDRVNQLMSCRGAVREADELCFVLGKRKRTDEETIDEEPPVRRDVSANVDAGGDVVSIGAVNSEPANNRD